MDASDCALSPIPSVSSASSVVKIAFPDFGKFEMSMTVPWLDSARLSRHGSRAAGAADRRVPCRRAEFAGDGRRSDGLRPGHGALFTQHGARQVRAALLVR